MLKVISIILLFASCANIKHALDGTNINILDQDTDSKLKEIDDAVSIVSLDQAKHCQLISSLKAKDNVYNSGEKYAIIELKRKASQLKANSITVDKVEKIGTYGHEAFGNAWNCAA
jgi:hypothetical protein